MPEEIEVPTEQLHETMHEHAHGEHGHGEGKVPTWIARVALSAAVIAVLAAIAALFAGHTANEAMLEEMQATDQWAYFQAKGIKASVLQSKMDLLESMEKHASQKDEEKVKEYAKEQKEIEEKAKELEGESTHHMKQHSVFARAVTTFQVAIAMSAISVLTKKTALWYASMVVGVIGAAFLAQAFLG